MRVPRPAQPGLKWDQLGRSFPAGAPTDSKDEPQTLIFTLPFHPLGVFSKHLATSQGDGTELSIGASRWDGGS